MESELPYGDYHRPIKAGQYAVTYSAEGYFPKTVVTDIADGQRLEQNVQLVKSVGIEDYERKVTVYPNPAWDRVHVEVDGGMDIAGIALYDMYGRIVETFHETSLQQTGVVTLDLRAFPAGTYFLHIRNNSDYEIIRKIVKQ